MGNPAPKVLFEDVTLTDVRRIGRNQDHLKLYGSNDLDQPQPLEMIGFSLADRTRGVTVGHQILVVGELSLNHWQDSVTAQLHLSDIGMMERSMDGYQTKSCPKEIYGIEDGVFLVHTNR